MAEKERDAVIWCTTVEETIITLWDYRDTLEKAMLDHDLGGAQYVNSKREDCGMEIVRHLEKLSKSELEEFEKFKKTQFIIHTFNTYAGLKMTERLIKIGLMAIYRPFGT